MTYNGMDILTSRRDDLGITTFGWLLKKLLFEILNAFLTDEMSLRNGVVENLARPSQP